MQLLDTLRDHARRRPRQPALRGRGTSLTYAELHDAVERSADALDGACVGLLGDNDPSWIVADLAALRRGLPCVPLPGFFTREQLAHVVADAGIDLLLCDGLAPAAGLLRGADASPFPVAGKTLTRLRGSAKTRVPPAIAKVTYTSGTTGTPKGVQLAASALDLVVASLARGSHADGSDRALSLLPLATLLENLGIYATLSVGACATLLPLAEVGIHGAAGADATRLVAALGAHRPTTLILVPQLLQLLVAAGEAGAALPASLRFVAVGGAPVADSLIDRARSLGLPVFQGYGLSEAASVVTMNRPGANRRGSVGQPLDHAQVCVAAHGEVLVRGALFSGYLGDAPLDRRSWWATGDVGYQDDDGYLYITGRRSHRFVTAYGRNVSPEWVEKELLAGTCVAQAVVVGDARPFNVALLVARPGTAAEQMQAEIAAANRKLPDYARVGRFALADEPFSVGNGELTGTGRPRRATIMNRYAGRLDALYEETVR